MPDLVAYLYLACATHMVFQIVRSLRVIWREAKSNLNLLKSKPAINGAGLAGLIRRIVHVDHGAELRILIKLLINKWLLSIPGLIEPALLNRAIDFRKNVIDPLQNHDAALDFRITGGRGARFLGRPDRVTNCGRDVFGRPRAARGARAAVSCNKPLPVRSDPAGCLAVHDHPLVTRGGKDPPGGRADVQRLQTQVAPGQEVIYRLVRNRNVLQLR